ncbi:LysR family transcriptional regulator [Cupriavidus basilensis]
MRGISDLQILRAFVAVGRDGNVSRAAEQLHLSQPAVSLQLKTAANHTGLQLFQRKPHGLELTPEGQALLPFAERTLSALTEFNSMAASLHSSVRGIVRIGTILDPEFTRLGELLHQLVQMAPHAEIELRQEMSGAVLEQVERDALDVGFYLSPSSDNEFEESSRIYAQELTEYTYRVVAPPGWRTRVMDCDWERLASLPWLSTPPQSIHSRLLKPIFGPNSRTGLSPKRVALVDQESSMIDLVKSGVGLSLMRDSIAIRESQAHGIEIVPSVFLQCKLMFICQRSRRNEPGVAAVWRALDRAWLRALP